VARLVEVVSDMQTNRRRRAISAARRIAAGYGIVSNRATILQDSNHTVIYLAPAPVVAKVGTSPEETSLLDEVKLAQFVAAKGGPVVPPTSLFPPGPHLEDGLEATFWEYCPHNRNEPSPDVHGQLLRILHDALEGYPDPLRAWDGFDGVGAVLADATALGALPQDDQVFLRRTYEDLLRAISSLDATVQVLHGEPHSGNLLLSPGGPRWIDLESACLGPQEWDLTVLPDHIIPRYFEDVNWDLLTVLRRMRSLCVAAWCWLDPDRAPVLREAGTYHLYLLKSSAGS
jgi:hypothetical protein